MRTRSIVPVAVAFCLLLIPVELGWISFLRYAWAANLWQYLPWPVTALLALGLVALCVPSVREGSARRMQSVVARTGRQPTLAVSLFAVLVLPFLFWLLRERLLYGDSPILLVNAASGSRFLFPDVGATFLFQLCHRLATQWGMTVQSVAQAAVAVAGGIAVACFVQVGREIAPSPERGVLAAVLILCGGLTRVLAGHVEVYAFLLACAGAYLWSALAALHDRTSVFVPALLAGLCIWVHLSGIFLLPSLAVVVALTAPTTDGRVKPIVRALVIAALPSLLFFLFMWISGRNAELEQAWRTMLRWTGLEPSPVGHEAFLRGLRSEPGAGTRYVVLSGPHLKYLANAFFLLAPFAVPVLIGFGLFAPRRFATRESIFLLTASVSLLVYTSVVRPVWGPYDWDLFSLTAVCLATLAAHLLVSTLDERALAHLGVLVVGATLLTVTIPFLAIGIAPANVAGPFALDGLATQNGETPIDALERILAPWL